MEHNNPTTKGLRKGAKSSDDAETPKPFSQSISYVIIVSSFIGLNLRGNGKFKIIYNVLYGFQFLGTALLFPVAILWSDLNPDDTQNVVAGLKMIGALISLLLINLQFRMSVDSLAVLIKRVDEVLMRFNGEQRRPLLWKLNIVKPVLIIISVLSVATYYYYEFERLHSSNSRYQIGNERYVELSEKYHLDIIKNISVPLSILAASLIGVIFASVFLVLHFIFAHFEKSNTSYVWSPSTDEPQGIHSLNDFINLFRIHREACELLRLTDKAFSPIFATSLAMLTFTIITNSRDLFVSGQAFAWSSLTGIITNGVWMLLIITVVSKINKMFEMSLSHLMQIGLQLQVEGKLSPRKAAALSAKLDLYITHVQLDSPAASVGGFVKIRPQLMVQICGLVLSYTVYLYSK